MSSLFPAGKATLLVPAPPFLYTPLFVLFVFVGLREFVGSYAKQQSVTTLKKLLIMSCRSMNGTPSMFRRWNCWSNELRKVQVKIWMTRENARMCMATTQVGI